MWMKGSMRQSDRPASTTRTRVDGSADSRFASTLPAEPPPTMMKSYPPSAMSADASSPPARSAARLEARGSGRPEVPPGIDRPLPVVGVVELHADRGAPPCHRRESVEHAHADPGRAVHPESRPALHRSLSVTQRLAPEVTRDLVEECACAHRMSVDSRLDRGDGHAPTTLPTPPFLVRAALAERSGHADRPSLVMDRDGASAIPDLRFGVLPLRRGVPGTSADLFDHRLLRAADLEQFEPRSPRERELGVERERAAEQAEHLIVDGPLLVAPRVSPTDIGPHQAEGSIDQVPGVGRVSPPRRDLDRDPRVGQGPLQPRIVA